MIESFLFFLGIVMIVGATTWCVTYGIATHHKREMYRNQIREAEVQQMYLLSEKALDMGKLPPAFTRLRDQ